MDTAHHAAALRRERLEFANAGGARLAGLLESPPSAPLAYALFAHCFTCSKDVAAASRISRALAARGIATVRFDFTGLGNSEGDFANTDFSSNVQDLLAAVAHLRETREAPKLLVGHSLGGAAVLAAAADVAEATAVVTIGAPADPAHVAHLFDAERETIEREGEARVTLAGRSFTIRRQFLDDVRGQRLGARIRAMRKALLVFHSPGDEIVGVDNAAAIFEAALHPKSFVSLDRADHLLSRAADSEYVAATIAAWASRYVTGEPAAAAPRPAVAEGEVLVRERDHRFTQDVLTAHHELRADEPRGAGGADRGPSPYELLLAALGTCTAMTLRMYADRKAIPLAHVEVRLAHDRIHAEDCAGCETREGRVERIRRTVHLEGEALGREDRERLLAIADRCPVHRTLGSEIRIETSADD